MSVLVVVQSSRRRLYSFSARDFLSDRFLARRPGHIELAIAPNVPSQESFVGQWVFRNRLLHTLIISCSSNAGARK